MHISTTSSIRNLYRNRGPPTIPLSSNIAHLRFCSTPFDFCTAISLKQIQYLKSSESIMEPSSNQYESAQTSMPLKAGDLVLSSMPYAYVLDKKVQATYCDACVASHGNLRKCSSCASVYYCNVSCQRKAWPLHKLECSLLQKKCGQLVTTTARLITRIILTQQIEKKTATEIAYEGRSRTFEDLISHEEEIKLDEKSLERFTNIRQQLILFLGEDELPTNLLSIYGKVVTNGYTMTNNMMDTIGLGVYLAGSIFDHSCAPNAHATFIGKRLVIQSLVDWECLDWDQVRISYIDTLQDTESRRKELSSEFYFTCHCVKCEDKEKDAIMNSVICGGSSCNEEIILESNQPPCLSCGFNEYDDTTLARYTELIESTKEVLKTSPDAYSSREKSTENLEKLISRQKEFLSPRNVWRVKTQDYAFESCIYMNNMKMAQAYGSENLEGLRYCLGDSHPVLGLQYLKLAKVEKYLFHVAETFTLMEKAEQILRKSHRVDSHFYQKDVKRELETARLEMQLLKLSPTTKES